MNLTRTLSISMTLALSAVLIRGCGPRRKVSRTSANSTAGGDLSGYWNDIDANLVSEEMIKDCLSRPWASDFQSQNEGAKPVVKLMGVVKRTDDRNVNTQYFAKRLERR